MRRLLGVVVAAMLTTACDQIGLPTPPPPGPGPVTTMVVPADLGPPPADIPAAPRQVIVMLPGSDMLDPVHREFVESQEGYVERSARVEAVYQSSEGPLSILIWQQDDPRFGPMSCSSVAPAGVIPGGLGCGGRSDEPESATIFGTSYTTQLQGRNFVEVGHSPGAEATVIELTDGSAFVIRPGESSISYHQWDGAPSARITVFWQDGSSDSQLTGP